MLVNPHVDSEARQAADQQDAAQQKYETMQCFAVSEPKSIKEEGEGKITSLDTSVLRASMKPGWEDMVRRCIQRFHLQSDGEMSFAKKHHQEGQGSPSITSGVQSAMLSPRHRQSPSAATSSSTCSSPHLLQHQPGSFSPAAGLNSPPSVCSTTGNNQSFNSLSALQALTQGTRISPGLTEGQHPESPDRKPASLQSPLHSTKPGGQINKSNLSLEAELFGTFEEQGDFLSSHSQDGAQVDGKDIDPDTLGGNGNLGDFVDAANRHLTTKGHTKLLQLLTTKLEPSDPSSPPGPMGDDQNYKDQLCGAGHNNQSTSLKEKHKILHRLLQNSTSPVELAKLTAEATGKDPIGPESASGDSMAALSELCTKQEPESPKKKDNALLRYLLDRDDNGILDKAIKMEPGDGLKLTCVKTEKQDEGFNLAEPVRILAVYPEIKYHF
ncbi:hypothetical protein XENOCAPTIV_009881 [Xenoophorus captivus]|uniref:Uncharacterized protein n=1 Tax=Xenoophorus captivus TaxID=1517983 RepID=A0ABV0RLQ9_9TELE